MIFAGQNIVKFLYLVYMATYSDYNPSKHNDFMTPKCIFEEIKSFIPDTLISMPFYGDGTAGKHMTELGFDVIHQDEDFFEFDRGEVVVDNPPYGKFKKLIIEKLIERNKPFMLLMPVSTMCYKYSKILKDNLQILIPKSRPKYIYYDKRTGKTDADWKKKSAAFDSVWFCWKMNFEKDINFL